MNFKPSFEPQKDKPEYESVVKYMVPVKDLVTFRPDQTIMEVIDIIIEKRISGAPVMNESGKLVGIISERDCLRIIVDQAYHNLPMEPRKVSDYMTVQVKTLSADSDVLSAANEFLGTPIRRLPIVDKGVLIGQISRRDMLRAAKNIRPANW
jgi:CBS domain-containing protein